MSIYDIITLLSSIGDLSLSTVLLRGVNKAIVTSGVLAMAPMCGLLWAEESAA